MKRCAKCLIAISRLPTSVQENANIERRTSNVERKNANIERKNANIERRNANIEHRTPNFQRRTAENQREKENAFSLFLSPLLFDVRRSMFNVRCSYSDVRIQM